MTQLMRNFTTAQAAAILEVSPRTLESWRLRGEGPDFVKLSRSRRARVRYSEKALAEFVAKMTHPGVDPSAVGEQVTGALSGR